MFNLRFLHVTARVYYQTESENVNRSSLYRGIDEKYVNDIDLLFVDIRPFFFRFNIVERRARDILSRACVSRNVKILFNVFIAVMGQMPCTHFIVNSICNRENGKIHSYKDFVIPRRTFATRIFYTEPRRTCSIYIFLFVENLILARFNHNRHI